jgi:hypothetical protein
MYARGDFSVRLLGLALCEHQQCICMRTDESEFGVLNKFNVLFALEFSSRFYFTAVEEKTGTDKFLEIKRSLRAIFSRP